MGWNLQSHTKCAKVCFFVEAGNFFQAKFEKLHLAIFSQENLMSWHLKSLLIMKGQKRNRGARKMNLSTTLVEL